LATVSAFIGIVLIAVIAAFKVRGALLQVDPDKTVTAASLLTGIGAGVFVVFIAIVAVFNT
tara:strand:+ start:371 stop:553 length:183 start_codon:yes stop_codon:yes gene_type:complete